MTNIILIVGVLLFLSVTLLVVSGRFGDVFYIALTNGKATLFVCLFLAVGTLGGLHIRYGGGFSTAAALPDVSMPVIGDLYQTSEERTLATIRNCQAFVTAELDAQDLKKQAVARTRPERADGSPPLLHLASDVLPGTSKDWDRCARAFGMNYWKQDISVKNENGGIALCRAYHAQDEYQSGDVNAWCDTVFADKESTVR